MVQMSISLNCKLRFQVLYISIEIYFNRFFQRKSLIIEMENIAGERAATKKGIPNVRTPTVFKIGR